MGGTWALAVGLSADVMVRYELIMKFQQELANWARLSLSEGRDIHLHELVQVGQEADLALCIQPARLGAF